MLTIALQLLLAAALASPVPTPSHWEIGPAGGGGGGRVLFSASPVLAKLAANPDYVPHPTLQATADDEGRVTDPILQNGWAETDVHADSPRTVIVTGRGFAGFFVNGERYVGDPYGNGIVRLPVPLREGTNHILVRAIRGGFTFRILPAEGTCSLNPKDALVPNLRQGKLIHEPGAVVVLNHTGSLLTDAVLEIGDGRVVKRETVPVGAVLPYGIRKPAFPIRQLRAPKKSELDDRGRYRLPVLLREGATAYSLLVPMQIRKKGQAYTETRISGIDGSVQYDAVRAPISMKPGKRYALFFSLHGAGVHALNQASAYTAKPDAFIVAPTNRRPFGFDWQDWGRLDALEALHDAMRLPVDKDRVYLVGHSMGGHGTWYLGCLYTDRFAAIAPSAGWASFFTYTDMMPRTFGLDPDLAPFAWTENENDTIGLLENLTQEPVFVLQGGADDNVPPQEARHLVALLGRFNHDHIYREVPGMGHWWGGGECVDYMPLFDFCRRHRRVEKPHRIHFTTFNPAVTARDAWVTIDQQILPARMSTVDVVATPRKGTIVVTTDNVARLTLDLRGVMGVHPITASLDGETMPLTARRLTFTLRGGRFRLVSPKTAKKTAENDLPPKSPTEGGPFKLAFAKRMVFVYGTHGNARENAAILAKVRYDEETWWYRGNGSVTVVPDRDFDPKRFAGRNVILYGNTDTNTAFAALLPHCPIQIHRGAVTVGPRTYRDEMGLYMVYPRPDCPGNLVGVVGATSAAMMRGMESSSYFVSGIAIPDWVVFSKYVLTAGMRGVAAAGYFTNDWRLGPRAAARR